MESVDYANTFITVSADCPVAAAVVPPPRGETPTVASETYRMIAENPYRYRSSDVIFTVWADRRGIPEAERPAARAAFYAKSQACLRSSDLGKRFGWGVHADRDGFIALYAVESDEYRAFAAGRSPRDGTKVTVRAAMRGKR